MKQDIAKYKERTEERKRARARKEAEAKAKEEARIKEQEEAKAKEADKRMKKTRPSLHAQIRNTLGFENIDKDHKHHNRVIALLSEGHIDKAIIAFSNISHKFYNDGKYNSEADTCKEEVMSYQNLSSEFGLALRQKFHISHQSLMESIINDNVYEALNVIRLMPNDFYAHHENFDKMDKVLSHNNIDPNIIKEVLKKTLSDKVTNPQLITHLGDKLPHLDTPVHKSILKVSCDYSNNSDLKPLVVISSKHLLELGITNIKNTYKLDEKRKAMKEKQQLGHGVSGGGDREEAARSRDEFLQARTAQTRALITYGESSEYEIIRTAVNLFIPDTDEGAHPKNLLEYILETEKKMRNEGGHSPSK